MLKEILKTDECKKCKICCGFDEDDKWEIPLIFSELKDEVEKKTNLKLIPRGNEYVFDMEFNGDNVVFCPALGEHGCTLGELKPFDCKIWPFRVNSLGNFTVITVSPVCPSVSALPLSTLTDFLNRNNLSEILFAQAQKHPDMIKPYINGYPILAVKKLKFPNK